MGSHDETRIARESHEVERATAPSRGEEDHDDDATTLSGKSEGRSGTLSPTHSQEEEEAEGSAGASKSRPHGDGNNGSQQQQQHDRLAPKPSNRSLSRTVSEVRDGISTRHHSIDLERGSEAGDEGDGVTLAEKTTTSPDPSNPNLVTWSGPDDQENPKNWPWSRKWLVMFIVSLFSFVCPLASSMVAPSLTTIAKDLDIHDTMQEALVLSVFILGFAVGPLFWGPLSEIYGRVPIIQSSNIIFLFFNLGCGLAKTQGQLTAFRFLSGMGGSAMLACGGGVLGDLFTPEERGRALSVYSLMPLLGPSVGPIIGGFITQYSTWRWAFYATCIVDFLIQVVGIFYLSETYAPALLTKRRNRLAKETGNENLHTPFDSPERTVGVALRTALYRPVRLLVTQPIVQFISLYLLYLYGLIYLVLTTFPTLWSSPRDEGGYGMSISLGGLNYISLGVGFWAAAQVGSRLQDIVYAALKRRYGVEKGRPEFRVPIMIPSGLLVPIGLLIYGWAAEYRLHPVVPNIGAFIFAAGTVSGFQCLQGFLIDAYTRYAASAVGAATVLRSCAGFGFPLFAGAMYDRLGLGWGNTLLAFLGLAIGIPGPLFLWKYGEALRRKSQFAAGGG